MIRGAEKQKLLYVRSKRVRVDDPTRIHSLNFALVLAFFHVSEVVSHPLDSCVIYSH